MAFDIGQLVGFVKIDHAGVGTGMAAAEREVKASTARMGQQADQGGKAVGSRFGKGISSSAVSSLKMLSTAVVGAFAVDKVVTFFGDAVKGASDLNETVSASSVIFGKQADAVQTWAKGSSKAFGLSEQAALDAATGLGDLLLQLGDTGDEAAKTSQNVVQMAADLGSFKNLETGDVLDRITASLRGEFDSLQAVIPNINAARVETEALAATGKKSATQLTAQEKAHATLAIIQKDGIRAQGDFARTADGLANSQKIAAAESENLKAKIGQQLLPIMKNLTQFTSGTVLPAFSGLVDLLVSFAGAMNSIPGPVKGAVVALVIFHLLKGPLSSMLETTALKAMYARDGIKGLGGAAGVAKGGLKGLIGMLGGPWGIALTGAIAGLTAFAQAQADAKADADSLTDSIDKQTGQFTKSSREIVANKIRFDVNADDLALLKGAGVELGKLADETLNGGPAFDARIKQLQEMADKSGNLGIAARGLLLTLLRERDAAVAGYAGFKAQGDLLPDVTTKTDDLADATGSAADKAKDAKPATDNYAAAVGKLKTMSSDAAEKQKDLAAAMNDVVDAALSADEAQSNYEEAIDAARKAAEENGKTTNKARTELDLNTEAGRANASALRDLAKDARDSAEANLTQGDSAATVTEKMTGKGGMRDAFIAAAEKMGLSKTAAGKLATEYGLTKTGVDNLKGSMDKIPAEVVSKLKVEKDKAEKELAMFKRVLAGVTDKTVTISAVYQILGSQAAYSALNQRQLDRKNLDRRFGGDVPGYALGTLVGPGTGTSDSIGAFVAETGRRMRLSAGEFVSTDSSRRRNLAALEAGNKGAMLGVVGQGGGGLTQLHPDSIDAIVDGFARAASRVSPIVDLEDMSGRLAGGM